MAEITCIARENIYSRSEQEAVNFFLVIELNHLLISIIVLIGYFMSRSKYRNQYKTRDNQNQSALRLTKAMAPLRIPSLGTLYPLVLLSTALSDGSDEDVNTYLIERRKSNVSKLHNFHFGDNCKRQLMTSKCCKNAEIMDIRVKLQQVIINNTGKNLREA